MMEHLSYMLPACAPDLGGAASMLAEMGGMVIIHDAAGCMENYIVYDEPRWFGMDSMLYSSSLVELDAVLGNDEPLICGAVKAAQQLHPAFIAIIGSPVPAVTGMDLSGIAAEIEFRSGTPSFALDCSGFKPYHQGAGAALKALVQRFEEPACTQSGTLNLLGVTPLDFSHDQLQAICTLMTDAGWQINGTFCMNTTLDQVRTMAQAEHNLVISQSGLPAAKLLKRKYGIPFTCCCPVTAEQAACVGRKAETPRLAGDPRILVVGELLFAQSVSAAFEQALHVPALALSDTLSESELTAQFIRGWDLVLADPLCEALCPPGTEFFGWPHTALSSHLYPPAKPQQLDLILNSLPHKQAAAAERSNP